MKHMIIAAEAGNADAQYNLGIMYDNRVDDHGNSVNPTDDNGVSIASDRATAMKWLGCAAEQGLARAQTRLAELYAEGPLSPETDIAACKWFTLARFNLNGVHRQRAQRGYDQVCLRLSAEQVALALSQAHRHQSEYQQAPTTKSYRLKRNGKGGCGGRI